MRLELKTQTQNTSKIDILRLGFTSFLVSSLFAAQSLACSPDVVEIKGPSGKFRFNVVVADNFATRAQGLMHVEAMPQFDGMLFVYEEPHQASFWMKNTLIPLDMLFSDPTGTVTSIHENAAPESEDVIDGGDGVLVVLEINGGLAKKFGINEGAVLRHPAIDQAIAAWPCEK